MSLKGSLETFALPEVLQLLADTSKTGQLYLQGQNGFDGRLWFQDGAIAAFDVEGSYEPDDAIFEMLGVSEGEFSFDADSPVAETARIPVWDRHDLRAELGKAQAKVAEWVEVLSVVPSLGHRVHLNPEAPADHVSVDRGQWEMLAAIGDGRTIQQVLSARSLGKFDGCKAVKGLVDAGLARVAEPRPEPVAVIEESPAEVIEPVEAGGPEGGGVEAEAPIYEAEADPVDHEAGPFAAEPEPFAAEAEPFAAHSEPVVGDPESEPVEAGAPETGPFAWESEPVAWESEPVAWDPEPGADDVELGDPYASLRAAITDASDAEEHYGASAEDSGPVAHEVHGEQAASWAGLEAEPVAEEGEEGEEEDGRSALRALLAEVSAQAGDEPDAEPVDGLMDRGPWTSHELASLDSMGGWRDEDRSQEASGHGELNVVPFPSASAEVDGAGAVAANPEEQDEAAAEDEAPADEPINRGLLLKFLSSVRN